MVVSLGIRDKIDLCLGYCLCPGTVVLGPWLPFQEYQNIFIKPRNKQFDNPVFSSVHGAHPSPTRGGGQVSSDIPAISRGFNNPVSCLQRTRTCSGLMVMLRGKAQVSGNVNKQEKFDLFEFTANFP